MLVTVDLRQVWERRAKDWLAWARTPKHDSFWAYSGSFFEEVVPEQPGVVLDVGCGEGRVARALKDRSASLVALDSSPTLVSEAKALDSRSFYVIGDGTKLPFASESFDTVVAYNSLMDLNDLHAGVSEAARVLRTSGSFCVCILHPVGDIGHFASDEEDAPFLIDNYYEAQRYEQRHDRAGLTMTFNSWHHPLGDYTDALQTAGLLIDRLTEPLPDYDALGRRQWTRAERIPMFLFLRAVKAMRD